jgi:hypothetical protein
MIKILEQQTYEVNAVIHCAVKVIKMYTTNSYPFCGHETGHSERGMQVEGHENKVLGITWTDQRNCGRARTTF